MRSTLTFHLFFLLAVFFCQGVFGQANMWNTPKDLVTAALGTGQTTGHIATLSAKNTGDIPQSLDLGMFFIPSADGRFQSYVSFPQPEIITIEPGETIEIPIQGVCVNVNQPPIPRGNSAPPTSTWLVPNGNVNPDMPPAFSYNPDAISTLPRPNDGPAVTNIPIALTNDPAQTVVVDATKYPATAAQFLFDAVTRIRTTVEHMQSLGAIRTPFSNNPDKEQEAIVQQTVWMYSSALNGDNYTKDQFAERLEIQFEATSGVPLTAATDEQREKFNSGVDQFWNTFELVGMEAKVISVSSGGEVESAVDDNAAKNAAGEVSGISEDATDAAESAAEDVVNPPQQPPGETTDEKEDEIKSCECGEVFLNLRVKSENGDYNKSRDISVDSGDSDDTGKFDATTAKGQVGDEFDLTISDLHFECTCNGSPCETYKNKGTLSSKKRPGAEEGTVRISSGGGNCEVVRNNDDYTEIGVKLSDKYDGAGEIGYSISLVVEAICETDDCAAEHCYAYIQVSFSSEE